MPELTGRWKDKHFWDVFPKDHDNNTLTLNDPRRAEPAPKSFDSRMAGQKTSPEWRLLKQAELLEKAPEKPSPPSKESQPAKTAPPTEVAQEHQETLPLAIQVERRLGSDQARINRFWDAVYYWALAPADVTEIKDITAENLQSLIDNWDSVEAALQHPALSK